MNNEQNIADLIEQLMAVAKNPSDASDTFEEKPSKKKEKSM